MLPQVIVDQIASFLSPHTLHRIGRRINKQWKKTCTKELKTRMEKLWNLLPAANSNEQKEKEKIAVSVIGKSLSLEVHKYHLNKCVYTWTHSYNQFAHLSAEEKSKMTYEEEEEAEWSFTHNFLMTVSLPQHVPQNYVKLKVNKTLVWHSILPLFTTNGCDPKIFCKDTGIVNEYLEMLMLSSKETSYLNFHKSGPHGHSSFVSFVNDSCCLSFSLLPSSFEWISPMVPRITHTVCVLLQDRSNLL